jgi:glycosyltransferase involved in cell wall biosynthesis
MTVQLSNRPRSIVFLGTAHDNGGSSILASNLAEAMRLAGHHVEEWYLFGSNLADMPAGARVFHNGPRSSSPFSLAALCARLIAQLRAHKPDAVFGLQSLSNLLAGVGGRIAGTRNRVPTYHLEHERQNPALMIVDAIVSRLGCYTHMIACGENVAESYTRNSTAYAPMSVVANGQRIPKKYPRAEARATLGLPAQGIVIGQLGRLYYQKNQSFSLDLLQQLPEALLALVGVGPDEASLMSKIKAAGLEDRTRIIPSIARERIGLFYSAVDLVLFPSLFEGLSLAAIEAIHAGVPLLCSDIPSFREMFAASPLLTEKLVLPTTDRSAWLTRIGELLTDRELRSQIVIELARLSPTYAFETMAQQYLRLVDCARAETCWPPPHLRHRNSGHRLPNARRSPA